MFFLHPFFFLRFLSGLMCYRNVLPGGCQAWASFLTLADSEEGALFFFCRALPKQQNAEVGLRFISNTAWCPLRLCAKTKRSDLCARVSIGHHFNSVSISHGQSCAWIYSF
jgi:hypothetical protein